MNCCPQCGYDLRGDIGASNHNQSERLRWMTKGEEEGLGLTSTKAAYWEARCALAEARVNTLKTADRLSATLEKMRDEAKEVGR